MLKIKPSKQAAKFLKGVPTRHGRQLIAKINELAQDPSPPDAKDLKGYALPLRRVTSGEQRIIYYITDGTLGVLLIGKRNDDEVYRQLRRMS